MAHDFVKMSVLACSSMICNNCYLVLYDSKLISWDYSIFKWTQICKVFIYLFFHFPCTVISITCPVLDKAIFIITFSGIIHTTLIFNQFTSDVHGEHILRNWVRILESVYIYIYSQFLLPGFHSLFIVCSGLVWLCLLMLL